MTAVRQCGPHNQIERPMSNDSGTLRCGTSPTTGLHGKGAGGFDALTTEEQALVLDLTQFVLDIVGIFEPTPFADGTNAIISAGRRDFFGAGLSVLSIIPYLGDLAKAGKLPKYCASLERAIKLARSNSNYAAYIAPLLSRIQAGIHTVSKSSLVPNSIQARLNQAKNMIDDFLGSSTGATRADDKAFNQAFKGGKDEGAFETAERLKRGNLGEKLATDALAAEGHKILSYKPNILGTNQGGIDMVTIKDGLVHFIDNKALSRSGNVSSVSALTSNFTKNKDAVLKELKDALARAPSKGEKDVLHSAVTAIEKGNYKKVVTNANLTKDDAILSGVSQTLKDEGLEFIDVFMPLGPK